MPKEPPLRLPTSASASSHHPPCWAGDGIEIDILREGIWADNRARLQRVRRPNRHNPRLRGPPRQRYGSAGRCEASDSTVHNRAGVPPRAGPPSARIRRHRTGHRCRRRTHWPAPRQPPALPRRTGSSRFEASPAASSEIKSARRSAIGGFGSACGPGRNLSPGQTDRPILISLLQGC